MSGRSCKKGCLSCKLRMPTCRRHSHQKFLRTVSGSPFVFSWAPPHWSSSIQTTRPTLPKQSWIIYTKQFLLLHQSIADDPCSTELAVNNLEKAAPDHATCMSVKSNQRPIFHVAGYVAWRFLSKTSCNACKKVLLADRKDKENLHAAQLTQLKDNGPPGFLFSFLKSLENLFTGCFRAQELHHESTIGDPIPTMRQRWMC